MSYATKFEGCITPFRGHFGGVWTNMDSTFVGDWLPRDKFRDLKHGALRALFRTCQLSEIVTIVSNTIVAYTILNAKGKIEVYRMILLLQTKKF